MAVIVQADLPPNPEWLAKLPLESEGITLEIKAQVVHAATQAGGRIGFRFMHSVYAPIREKHERLLSKYLLAEQRRERQERKRAARA
jgi:hypothetical protein